MEVKVHIEKEVQSQSPPLLFDGSRPSSADNSTPVSVIIDSDVRIISVHSMIIGYILYMYMYM